MPNTDLSMRLTPRMPDNTAGGPVQAASRPAGPEASDATTATAASPKAEAQGDGDKQPQLVQAVERLNDLIQTVRRELHFTIDDATGRTIITVMDAETDEVVRQIPPEKVLSMIEALQGPDGGRNLLMDVEA